MKIINWFWHSEVDLVYNVENVYISENTFSNCGIDDWVNYSPQINRFGVFKFKSNIFLNGTNILNIPLKMLE